MAQFGPGGPPAVGVVQAREQPVHCRPASSSAASRRSITSTSWPASPPSSRSGCSPRGPRSTRGDLLYRLERGPFEADLQAKQASAQNFAALLRNATITVGRAQSLLNTPAGQRSTLGRRAGAAGEPGGAAAGRPGAGEKLADQPRLHRDPRSGRPGKIGRTTLTIGNVVSPASGSLVTIVSQDPDVCPVPGGGPRRRSTCATATPTRAGWGRCGSS